MSAIYFEDLTVGSEGASARRTVTDADIVNYCGVSGDFSPLHTDDLFIAEHTPFNARIAHGLLILGISSGLRSDLDNLQVIAYLDVQRRFVAPTYAGDTIHARWKVEGARRSSSRPDTGVATFTVTVVNQDDETVQHGTDVFLVGCRDAAHPTAETR